MRGVVFDSLLIVLIVVAVRCITSTTTSMTANPNGWRTEQTTMMMVIRRWQNKSSSFSSTPTSPTNKNNTNWIVTLYPAFPIFTTALWIPGLVLYLIDRTASLSLKSFQGRPGSSGALWGYPRCCPPRVRGYTTQPTSVCLHTSHLTKRSTYCGNVPSHIWRRRQYHSSINNNIPVII